MKNKDFKKITLEEIENAIADFFHNKEQPLEPDFIIIQNEKTFHVKGKFYGDREGYIYTGIGGLKLIFEAANFPEFYVIEYNGKILSKIERLRFIEYIKQYK